MQSAFGINHGEISKARRMTRAQKRTMGTNPNALTRPQQLKGKLTKVGEANVSLKGIGTSSAKGLASTSAFLGKRPALTGTALVAGGVGAGYHYLNQKEPKKKVG